MADSKLIEESLEMGIVSSTFVLTIIIKCFNRQCVNGRFIATDGSGHVRVLMEDGHLLENEFRDNIAQTSKETIVMLYTTQAEVDAQDMITQLRMHRWYQERQYTPENLYMHYQYIYKQFKQYNDHSYKISRRDAWLYWI